MERTKHEMALTLQRTRNQWEKCDPEAMCHMSKAAIYHALNDAKRDVLTMHDARRCAERVAAAKPPHREADVGPLLCEAATTLPEGWRICIEVECGYGGVNLVSPDAAETDFSGHGMLLSEQIRAAIDAANQARKGE